MRAGAVRCVSGGRAVSSVETVALRLLDDAS
jgi:hypothetical protein